MSEINDAFKTKVANQVREIAQKNNLSEIGVGRDECILTAKVDLPPYSFSQSFIEVIRSKKLLRLRVNQLCFLGQGPSLSNTVVDSLVSDIAEVLIDQERKLSKTDQMLHALLMNSFTSQRCSVWELMKLAVLEMNGFFIQDKVLVDLSDGEVYADTVLDCDFEEVPEQFKERLSHLIRTSTLVCDLLLVLRQIISNEPVSLQEHKNSLRSVKAAIKSLEQKPEETELSSEDEEEVTI